jgi:ribosomal protein S14
MNTKNVLKKILGDKYSKNSEETCDFCGKRAGYDGRTAMGPWAFMCPTCFRERGVGLGLGKGQVLK